MFRVGYSDTTGRQRWTLCGRLAGPWVEELRSSWRQRHEIAPQAGAIVDLTQVTFVDEAGEALLAEMHDAGAEFVVAGVDNKHLVECLSNHGERALRRTVEDLSAPRKESHCGSEGTN